MREDLGCHPVCTAVVEEDFGCLLGCIAVVQEDLGCHPVCIPAPLVLPPAQAIQEAPILSDDHFDQHKEMVEDSPLIPAREGQWCAKQNPLAPCRQP